MNIKRVLKTIPDPSGHIKPRPPFKFSDGGFIQLPDNQKITYMTTYAPERITYPKWQFWRKTVTKYYLMVATDRNKLYTIDPDVPSVTEEKPDFELPKYNAIYRKDQ